MADPAVIGHFLPVNKLRRLFPDLLILAILLLLPLLIFFPVSLGNKTLIPADNLFQLSLIHI